MCSSKRTIWPRTPVWGPTPVDLLDRLVYRDHGAYEYWGHAASILDIELYPALRWRMDRRRDNKNWAGWLAKLEVKRPGYADRVHAEVRERGPLTFTQLVDPARREPDPRYSAATTLWDRGSDGKTVLDCLYSRGDIAVAGRRGFSPMYDLAERVIPESVLPLANSPPRTANVNWCGGQLRPSASAPLRTSPTTSGCRPLRPGRDCGSWSLQEN